MDAYVHVWQMVAWGTGLYTSISKIYSWNCHFLHTVLGSIPDQSRPVIINVKTTGVIIVMAETFKRQNPYYTSTRVGCVIVLSTRQQGEMKVSIFLVISESWDYHCAHLVL